jgi:hypothetical protein
MLMLTIDEPAISEDPVQDQQFGYAKLPRKMHTVCFPGRMHTFGGLPDESSNSPISRLKPT